MDLRVLSLGFTPGRPGSNLFTNKAAQTGGANGDGIRRVPKSRVVLAKLPLLAAGSGEIERGGALTRSCWQGRGMAPQGVGRRGSGGV